MPMHELTHTPPPQPARSFGAASHLIHAIERHACERPNAEAVGELDGLQRRCTYSELADLMSSRATCLRDRVRPGQVVLAVMPSGVDYVAWFCGAIAAGVRFLPMHPQIAGPEALAVAKRSRAVAAVIAPEMRAGSALQHLEPFPLVPTTPSGTTTLTLSDHTGAVVLGSSGTTGLPKLALRESPSLDADAAAVIAGMGLNAVDRVVFATPLGHSYGVDVLVATLTAGATLRVMAQCDTELIASELESSATVLPGVPFVIEALARRARRQAVGVRLVLSAGSPVSPRLRRAFSDAWGVDVGQLYGATELGTVSIDAPGMPGFDPTSVGTPLPGVSMRVVDPANPLRALEDGQEGHLVVQAPSMLSAYLDGDVPLVDGHLLTGDLGTIDPTGRVRITGRLKMLIDVGAYKVNPLEIEEVLCTHPGVAECVVVPIVASESLQRLRAVVVLVESDRPPTPADLRRFMQERVSAIKVPRVVEIVSSLPKSPAGKVLRDRV